MLSWLCPMIPITSRSGTPAARRYVAVECRRSWTREQSARPPWRGGLGVGADEWDQSLAALGLRNGQPPGASVDSLEGVADGDDAVVQVDVRPAECEGFADPQASAEEDGKEVLVAVTAGGGEELARVSGG